MQYDNLTSEDFWNYVNLIDSLQESKLVGEIFFSKKDTSGVLLDIYNETDHTFSDSSYFRQADVDRMKFCAIRLLLNIIREGEKATGPNPTYWYNIQIKEYAGWISELKKKDDDLSEKEKNLLWNVILGFFDRWYSGSRYIYRQKTLWNDICEDFKTLGYLFPILPVGETVYINFFARFLAARIAQKMHNIEGD